MLGGAPKAWGSRSKQMPLQTLKKEEPKEEPNKGREIFGSAAPKPEEEPEKLVVGEGAFRAGGFKSRMSEEERAKMKIMGVLNRMAPEKFEKLAVLLIEENKILENDVILKNTVELIFKRATTQQDLCSMFADLCSFISNKLDADRSKAYKRMLLETVQSEYEALKNLNEDEAPKKRRLGNIQFVGDLYTKKLLNSKVMHFILSSLLPGMSEDTKEPLPNPSEINVELFCKLLATAGEQLDSEPSSAETITSYFRTLAGLAKNSNYSARIRFMMQNTETLRQRGWPDTNSKALTISDQQKVMEERIEKSTGLNIGDRGHTGASTAWGASAEIVETKNETLKKEKEAKAKEESKKDKEKNKDKKNKNNNKKKKNKK
eukprot:TRINITY_DN8697_c1_g3_i1.p1 TRINITY_DN8697_c1_g3~~TRINITY_DN8697_c1_g3_i1.p1  ORF type:complete len:375 (+),score=101.31 TRINITY_DN8697_c1_g3_i1:45-1169(+)